MASYSTALQKLYVAYFSRPGDVAGMTYWEGVVEGAQGDTSAVSAAFAGSAEYQAAFAGKSNAEIVQTVYQNLFGRPAETAGVAYWAGLLDQHAITIDSVVTAVAGGAQGSDLDAFNSKVTAAGAFTAAMSTPAQADAYAGPEALAAARAFIAGIKDASTLATELAPAALAQRMADFVQTSHAPLVIALTPGIDAGPGFTGGGGDDQFTATGATFSAGDALDGGGGGNKLTIRDTDGQLASGSPPQAHLAHIQDVEVTAAGAVGGGHAFDLSTAADLQLLQITAHAAVSAKLPDTAQAVVTAPGSVTLAGGKSVAVSGATGSVDLSGDALASVTVAHSAAPVTVTNHVNGHALQLFVDDVTGGATIRDATAGQVDLTVGASASSSFRLGLDQATILNIADAGRFTLNASLLASAGRLSTLNLRGTGDMSSDLSAVTSLTTFDASGFAGATSLKLAGAGGLHFSGGAGIDSVQGTDGLSGLAAFDFGAANDRYTVGAAAAPGAQVNGGTGYDTLAVADGAFLDYAAPLVYSGFEELDFSGGGGTYDVRGAGGASTLTAQSGNHAAVDFVGVATGTTLQFRGQGGTTTWSAPVSYALADASGSGDAVSIKLLAADGVNDGIALGGVDVQSLKAADIETVRVSSAVEQVDADLLSTPWSEATVPSSYSNTIEQLLAPAAHTLILDGAASLRINSISSDVLALIDASAASGSLSTYLLYAGTYGGSGAITYLGGSGADAVTAGPVSVVFQGNEGGDALTLVAGQGSDVVRFVKASDSVYDPTQAYTYRPTMDSILHFDAGTDKFDLSALNLGHATATAALALHQMTAASDNEFKQLVLAGSGFFNDGTANRAVALAYAPGGENSWLFVDANGDGNYSAGVDMVVHLVYTAKLGIGDFIF